MSAFLKSLVRSEARSCSGKVKYPKEESAIRNALAMTLKKGNGEQFSHYACVYCGSYHIGHVTSFDWIPESHESYSLLINRFECCNCVTDFFTNTCVPNRVLLRYPAIKEASEVGNIVCTNCRHMSDSHKQLERRFIELRHIDPNSSETLATLWATLDGHSKLLETGDK